MLKSLALVSLTKVAVMMLMIFGTGVEAAPTERDFLRQEKSLVPNPSQYLKQWLLITKAAGLAGTTRHADRTTTRTFTTGVRAGRWRTDPATAGPDKQAQMLKMISALEELHRTFNSTLSSRITIVPRANGRNSGRKNKAPPAADGGVKSTTAAPAAVDSTAPGASADVIVPSLNGRNFKKSLPPQNKKTNKRVCFWKYCSQN